MFIRRTNLLCVLLIFGAGELQGQSIRQQTQDPLFQRGIPTKHNQAQLRFVSQPVTTRPSQFFQQQQQPQIGLQNSDFSPDQLRVVNEQNAFRKSVAQANTLRNQRLQTPSISSSQEIPVTQQQQNFFDQNANNFNVPEQQNVPQQQFNEPPQQFQGTVPQEQNVQQFQTFERLTPQNQQSKGFLRTRTQNQQVSIRRPAFRPTTTFVATHTNRRPQDNHTPESIIRSLTNIEEPIQRAQDISLNQNTEFTQPDQSELNIPQQRTNIKQRQRPKTSFEDEENVRHQAESAKYSFASEVNDRINDNNHIRAETRDGLKLSGVYSYSDGYFKRTVHYEADENGYRIVKEENEPIGDGPNTDPAGTADVAANVGGANIQYSIRAEEVPAQFFTQQNARNKV